MIRSVLSPSLTSLSPSPPRAERQYRCLGQWQENGLVYTYAQRTDVHQHHFECFVGGFNNNPAAVRAANGSRPLFIKEAGEHCQRHVDPFHYGMELQQVGRCEAARMLPAVPLLQPLPLPTPAVLVPSSSGASGASRLNTLAMAERAEADAAAAEAAVLDVSSDLDGHGTNRLLDDKTEYRHEEEQPYQPQRGVLLNVSIRRRPAADPDADGAAVASDFDGAVNALGNDADGKVRATVQPRRGDGQATVDSKGEVDEAAVASGGRAQRCERHYWVTTALLMWTTMVIVMRT